MLESHKEERKKEEGGVDVGHEERFGVGVVCEDGLYPNQHSTTLPEEMGKPNARSRGNLMPSTAPPPQVEI